MTDKDQAKKEWIEERAAIMEFDGGLSRLKAERSARRLYIENEKRKKVLKNG